MQGISYLVSDQREKLNNPEGTKIDRPLCYGQLVRGDIICVFRGDRQRKCRVLRSRIEDNLIRFELLPIDKVQRGRENQPFQAIFNRDALVDVFVKEDFVDGLLTPPVSIPDSLIARLRDKWREPIRRQLLLKLAQLLELVPGDVDDWDECSDEQYNEVIDHCMDYLNTYYPLWDRGVA